MVFELARKRGNLFSSRLLVAMAGGKEQVSIVTQERKVQEGQRLMSTAGCNETYGRQVVLRADRKGRRTGPTNNALNAPQF